MTRSLIRTMDPFGPIGFPMAKTLEEIFDEIFNDTSIREVRRIVEDYPVPISIYAHRVTGAGKIVVALPGFKEGDIKVIAEDGCLLIEAKHQEEDANKDEWEKISGKIKSREFSQRLRLTNKWALDLADIKFENGELEITLPVKEEMKRKELAFKK